MTNGIFSGFLEGLGVENPSDPSNVEKLCQKAE